MRGLSRTIHVERPASLETALELLSDPKPGWRPLAGGTDLMVELEAGGHEAANWLSLDLLPELKGCRIDQGFLRIGACVTYRELQELKGEQQELILLKQAARLTGARAVQARGTLGGNVANASPAADSVPVLLALDARVILQSARERREVPLREFYLGYRKTALKKDELLQEIRVPLQGAGLTYFRKVGTRSAQAISKVVMAAVCRKSEAGLRFGMALGSVAPVPVTLTKLEHLLAQFASGQIDRGLAMETLQEEICPIDDIRSTAQYRRLVAGNLMKAFLDRVEEHPW